MAPDRVAKPDFYTLQGDTLEIPPSVPHATSTGPDGMTYVMVKINVGLYPWSIVGMVK
jgi:hypothetical protein